MERRYQYRDAGWWGRRLVGLVVLATCFRVWFGPHHLTDTVHAQIPDSGLQFNQIRDAARETNLLLREIQQILKSHTFKVTLQGADNQADKTVRKQHARP